VREEFRLYAFVFTAIKVNISPRHTEGTCIFHVNICKAILGAYPLI